MEKWSEVRFKERCHYITVRKTTMPPSLVYIDPPNSVGFYSACWHSGSRDVTFNARINLHHIFWSPCQISVLVERLLILNYKFDPEQSLFMSLREFKDG